MSQRTEMKEMPILVNLRIYKGNDVIFIDRRSILGNPYKITLTCTREQSIAKYKERFDKLIESSPRFKMAVLGLMGKKIGCWCTPLACHGDIIIDYLKRMGDDNEQSP